MLSIARQTLSIAMNNYAEWCYVGLATWLMFDSPILFANGLEPIGTPVATSLIVTNLTLIVTKLVEWYGRKQQFDNTGCEQRVRQRDSTIENQRHEIEALRGSLDRAQDLIDRQVAAISRLCEQLEKKTEK